MATLTDTGVQKWVNVFGDVQIIQNLSRLETAMERKIVKAAIKKGLKPIVQAARVKAPKKRGYLKAAIKSKVTKMVSGKVYVDPNFMVARQNGEDRRIKLYDASMKPGQRKRDYLAYAKFAGIKNIQPAKYAHLVEFGTKRAHAKPFMTAAREECKDHAMKIIQAEIKRGLDGLNFKDGGKK